MKFKVKGSLSYDVFSDTTFIFNMLAAKTETQLVLEECINVAPSINFELFSVKHSDTRYIKLVAHKGTSFTISYEALVEVQHSKIEEEILSQKSLIMNLDHEVLPFISPSRHCESDKLMEFAKNRFGNLPNDYEKVLAIELWIHHNITYTAGSTNSSASATDTMMRSVGVCKDFAHLGIALCRALDIPARYFTAYASFLCPPDFHACFEAYLNGHWIVFDATRLAGLNGMVKISNGKDASESALASYFGDILCTNIAVDCVPVSTHFTAYDWGVRKEKAIAY